MNRKMAIPFEDLEKEAVKNRRTFLLWVILTGLALGALVYKAVSVI